MKGEDMATTSSSARRLPALVLGLAAALVLSGQRVPAAEPHPPLVRLELLGQVGGLVLAVAVDGDRAFVGIGPRLVVVDVTTPAAPVVVGQGNVLPDMVRGVAVSGR